MPSAYNTATLSLGTNLGNRLENLEKAIAGLIRIGVVVRKESSIYETEPWGVTDQSPFLNLVLEIRAPFDHRELLLRLKQIELECGRKPTYKWGPRLIDIDILFFGDLIVQSGDLRIPHKGIAARRFILVPLNEIDPGFVHPTLKRTVSELLHLCTDDSMVKPWKEQS